MRLLLVVWLGGAIVLLLLARLLTPRYMGTAVFEVGVEAPSKGIESAQANAIKDLKLHLPFDLAQSQAIEEAVRSLLAEPGMPQDTRRRLTPEGRMAEQQLILDLRRQVGITWEVRSSQNDRVSVEFADSDQWLAEHMPNRLVELYINRTYDRIRTKLRADFDFYAQKVADVRQKLEAEVATRMRFEQDRGDYIPDRPGDLRERLREIEKDIDGVRAQNSRARQKLAQLTHRLNDGSELPANDMAAGDGEPRKVEKVRILKEWTPEFRELLDCYRQLVVALTVSHGEEHPTIAALRERIEQLDREVDAMGEWVVREEVTVMDREEAGRMRLQKEFGWQQAIRDEQMRRQQLLLEIAAARSEVDTSANELSRLERRRQAFETLQANFVTIRREYDRLCKDESDLRQELARWEQAVGEAQMALAAEMAGRATQLRQVQQAEEPSRPQRPRFGAVAGVALFVPLLIGGVLAALPLRFSRAKRIAMTVAIPVLVLFVGFGLFDLHLRLESPGELDRWRADPVRYLRDGLRERSGDSLDEPWKLL